VDLESEFQGIVGGLEEAGIDYAVVGALAVAIWGAPRATTDIDLLVRPEDVAAVLGVARARGFDLEALPMTFRDGLEVRRISRIEGEDLLTLDLLLLNADLEPAWKSRRVVATLAGPVRVVSREALLQMKVAAGRPQDVGDVQRLMDLDR